MEETTFYSSFLVRLWHQDEVGWRIVIHNPHTDEQRTFESLEAMTAYFGSLEEVEKTEAYNSKQSASS